LTLRLPVPEVESDPMITLDELKTIGATARILEVDGDDGVAVRLMEMGLTEGEEIQLLRFAPLGDPIEYSIRGYRISLRSSEARRVRVSPLPS
jgi:Fe2+ transport system protein A